MVAHFSLRAARLQRGHAFAGMVLVASLVAAGCSLADPGDSDSAPGLSLAAQNAFCPAGFSFDSGNALCLSATEAVGPFPPSMIEFCKRFVANRGDGSNACETTVSGAPNTRWARNLAIYGRKNTLLSSGCARGTAIDATTGYCSDGTNVYGPFASDTVTYCKSKSGGNACESNRIGRSFAKPRPASGFSAATEIRVSGNGATIGKLVIAVGYAEGTLNTDGSATPAYYGHMDSGIPNIGLWSCTVCGSRSAAQADQYYYDTYIAPEVNRYLQVAGGLANHPMVAGAFFGLLVQSPAAALSDADSDDLALITLLARGRLSAPVTETKLLDLLVASWTVNGVMQWRSPDTGQIDPARGRADQLRRLRAYEAALRANGITPYP
jgi:hypothetical protein